MISHSSRASRAKQKPLKIIDRVHRQKDLMLEKVFSGEHNLRKIPQLSPSRESSALFSAPHAATVHRERNHHIAVSKAFRLTQHMQCQTSSAIK